jgi:hypothetical protein
MRGNSALQADSRKLRLDIERTAFDIIVYEKQGEKLRMVNRMKWPEIAHTIYSIELLNPNRIIYYKDKLLLTMQDGTQSVIEYGSLYYADKDTALDRFFLSEYNRIAARWTQITIPVERVRKVVFGTTRLTINPETGTLFPPDYRFDPYTGAPLMDSVPTVN